MNRVLQIIQVLSIVFVSAALVYFLAYDSDLISEQTGTTDSFNPKHKLHFSFKSGFYTEPIPLVITNPKDDSCTIFYSLDCSIPTKNSLKYGEAIHLNFSSFNSGYVAHGNHRASVIRCIAYRNDSPISEVKTGVFFIDSLIFSKYPFPILSMVVEQGLAHKDSSAEQRTHLTLVENNGVVGISQDAGLRILLESPSQAHLGSLELISRRKYGTRYFDYPIFKTNNKLKYQTFGLQIINNSSEFIKNNMNGLEADTFEKRLYAVYFNGEFEGVYNSVLLANK